MFSICRQTHPATGVEHAVSCCFFNNEETCLVTAGANIIKVFRLVPEGPTKEVNAAGQPIPPKMKLECLATYTLWGNIMSIASVKCPSAGRDLLLLSFKEAKLSVVQYDIHTNNLVTLSMHYFEEEDMKGGWTIHPHIPWIRVDPEGRCAVMLLYGKKLAVLPFRKDLTSEDGDPLDSKPLSDTKKFQPPQQITRAPTLASYVIVLKDLDEKIDNILDIQFLYGYYEPTLLLLYEPVRTFAGRTAVRADTCAMAGVSLNMSARVHPVIWQTQGLPFDCLRAVPIHKPLGGCLIMAVNSLIYLNQSVPPYGVSLNSIATHTTNFPLRIQEGVCITLDGSCVAGLGEARLALSLRGGQLYVLTLLADSVRSVRAFHLDRAAASVLTSCMCVIEEDFLFLGSRLGNSLLLRVTERENRMLFSVDKPLEATIDLTESESAAENAQREAAKEAAKDPQKDESAAKRRRVDDLSECLPTNVIDISDQDELEVYGSDIRTSTQLTSYVFEVCDSLLNICPIGSASMGEPALGARLELVTCSGRDKNGALTVLQRALTPHLVTAFDLPGSLDMWSVFGDTGERDSEAEHAYLLLSQEDSTMVLQTGQEINEVDNSGFLTGSPTIFAGNLGNNKFMVQVTTVAIRLLKNGSQVQSIQLDWTASSASAADPYVCVVSTCGKVLVLALREFKGAHGMSGRLAPTRQSVSSRSPAVAATVYRDMSGLFAAPDTENVQVKGEFTGKMKTNVKAEGFKPGTVYELNDEDELLYGGDQTPASMASMLLAEQALAAGPARRSRAWWAGALGERRASWWVVVARRHHLDVYSLPDMRLYGIYRDAGLGLRVLTDSLESVSSLHEGEDLQEEEAALGGAVGESTIKELLVVGLGHKAGRVHLFVLRQNDLLIYEAFKYPRGNLKLRFSRVQCPFPFGMHMTSSAVNTTENYPVRQLRYFSNVGGYSGVFACGAMLVVTWRGELRAHRVRDQFPPARCFAPFNNINCRHGFLYFNEKCELRICVVAGHLSYDAAWPARKVPLRMTPHHVTYHVESRTYCLVGSVRRPTTTYYKFNGEDKERTTENKGDRFPYPMQDHFSVMLFSPVSWEIIPNTKIELDEWEHVTCLKNVSLSYEGTRSGLRGYIAIGTNYNYSEDISSRGRIIIYDIIDVVPEPGQPLTKNRFKELYAKEQKGPVTALTQVLGYLVSAVGQKIYIWQLKDNDLVGIAFIDTGIYVHRLLALKNLIVVCDVYKSVSLLRYQHQHRTLSLVSRDLRNAQIYDIEFMVDNTQLGFLVSEAEGNFALYMYQPQARESYGGQRLIKKSDYHLGQQVHAMFRIAAVGEQYRRHVTMFTTLDGGVGYLLPLSEKMYRRLLMLQNVMNNYCCHLAGLNPRGFRTYRSSRRGVGGCAARGMLDGDLVHQYMHMADREREEIAKKIGTKVEEIIGDLYEIERLTDHF